MSRKRYNSGFKSNNSSQGQLQSTSHKRSSYEDSLAVECLIRAFLDKRELEDPILRVLFIEALNLNKERRRRTQPSRDQQAAGWRKKKFLRNQGSAQAEDDGKGTEGRYQSQVGKIPSNEDPSYYHPKNMDQQGW